MDVSRGQERCSMVRGTANGDVVTWQPKKRSIVESREMKWGEKRESIQESRGVRREVLGVLELGKIP